MMALATLPQEEKIACFLRGFPCVVASPFPTLSGATHSGNFAVRFAYDSAVSGSRYPPIAW
jgi:hypothetical protein